MFRRSSDDINMFMEATVGFMGKLADETVERTIIRTFTIQKPWVDKILHDALRSHTAAYKDGPIQGCVLQCAQRSQKGKATGENKSHSYNSATPGASGRDCGQ